MSNDFADAFETAPAAVGELSQPISAESTPPPTTPSDGASRSSIPDPDAAGREAAPTPGALSAVVPLATAAPVAPAPMDAVPVERAVEVLRADPTFAPFVALQQQVSGPDVQEFLSRAKQFTADPVAFHREMGEQLRAAGMLPVETPKAPPTKFALPEPDLRTEDNSQQAYSAAKMAEILDAFRADLTAQFTNTIQPFQSEHERLQAERQQMADQRAADDRLEQGRAQVRQAVEEWDGFRDVLPQIVELLNADNAKPAAERTLNNNLAMAYIIAKKSHQPALEERARQTVVADLNARAAAGTAPTRRRAATGAESRTPSGSFKDAFKNNPAMGEGVVSHIGL